MIKYKIENRNAFTMIELILVIVVLGIVASIGSSIIANIYEQYIIQRATHRVSLKTEIATQQIANLLSHRIPGTTLARDPDNLDDFLLVTDPTVVNDDIHTLLEWIGTDSDGFSAAIRPPWNGFCDVDASNQNTILTPGSDLTLADTIMSNLSNTRVSLTGGNTPAIFFKTGPANRYAYNSTVGSLTEYNVLTCMGVVNTNVSCISSVNSSAAETLDFQTEGSATEKLITEHYKLAWSAYAIRPIANGPNNFDLELYYNYQPWLGANHGHTAPTNYVGDHATLIKNITVFKFAESGNTFRFKLCAQENIGGDYNVTVCKEKAIIL